MKNKMSQKSKKRKQQMRLLEKQTTMRTLKMTKLKKETLRLMKVEAQVHSFRGK